MAFIVGGGVRFLRAIFFYSSFVATKFF
jgi:hypothetical protein